MMASRVEDDEMVVAPNELSGMMEMMRGQLVKASQYLKPVS